MRTPLSIRTVILCSSLALFSTTEASDFSFGFDLNGSDTPFSQFNFETFPGNCGVGGQIGPLCGQGNGIERPDPSTTPFYQGEAWINGEQYWHVIVGDPTSGFAMESYTRVASGTGFGSFSGGQPTSFGAVNLQGLSGNGWDPLGLAGGGVDFTGNGSGDPTKTVFRQVMGDGVWNAGSQTYTCATGEFCAEFLKGDLNSKPIFRQAINDDTGGSLMQMRFQLDMSNISYSDTTRAGTIINTLTLTDPSDSEFYLVDGNFDMATDTELGKSVVTAGRYRYIDCANPSFLNGGSCWQSFGVDGFTPNIYQEGSYSYADGETDPMSYNWGTFFDPVQNPFSGNKMKCDSSSRPDNCNLSGSPFF